MESHGAECEAEVEFELHGTVTRARCILSAVQKIISQEVFAALTLTLQHDFTESMLQVLPTLPAHNVQVEHYVLQFNYNCLSVNNEKHGKGMKFCN
jgi:hypothetical protein